MLLDKHPRFIQNLPQFLGFVLVSVYHFRKVGSFGLFDYTLGLILQALNCEKPAGSPVHLCFDMALSLALMASSTSELNQGWNLCFTLTDLAGATESMAERNRVLNLTQARLISIVSRTGDQSSLLNSV